MTKTTLAKVSLISGSSAIVTGGAAAGTLSAKTDENKRASLVPVKRKSRFGSVKKIEKSYKVLSEENNFQEFIKRQDKNFIKENQKYKNEFIDTWKENNSSAWEELFKARYSIYSENPLVDSQSKLYSVFDNLESGFVAHENNRKDYNSLNNACWRAYWMDLEGEKEETLDVVWLLCSKDGEAPE
ncbi:hypothetical protein MHSWG343_10770 [Candidatus Mycoplasma haematohominis]|uniref:Uncharacterized protein n=1 Tax=Candidatus Mycoplasma haematohominis TaxID=1494318 RepID=A0A478FUE8_9MOLU|nr:hypothetical protein MHSWG343_10770 [Candidatus Mycoplasma haemohominis]